MFNYGGYISNGGGTGPANPVTGVSPALRDVDDRRVPPRAPERLFAFLRVQGRDEHRALRPRRLPGRQPTSRASGLPRAARQVRPARRRLARRHERDRLGRTRSPPRRSSAPTTSAPAASPPRASAPTPHTLATAAGAQPARQAVRRGRPRPGVLPQPPDEFTDKYVDDGVLKTAFDILMERTDPRYVAAEIDVFWSSDAFDDVTGTQTAALINKWPDARPAAAHQGRHQHRRARPGVPAPPRATGTGELDFRPIFAAANNRVRYYHQEQDGGTLTDADISFTNLKGSARPRSATLLGLPPSFTSVPARHARAERAGRDPEHGRPAADHHRPDASVRTPTTARRRPTSRSPARTARPPGASPARLATPTSRRAAGHLHGERRVPAARSDATSVARLQFTSDSDNATERVLLAGQEPGRSVSHDTPIGGDVPGMLALTVPRPVVVRDVRPGRRAQLRRTSAATSRARRATRRSACRTETGTATGHLVNGALASPPPLQCAGAERGDTRAGVRAARAADAADAHVLRRTRHRTTA